MTPRQAAEYRDSIARMKRASEHARIVALTPKVKKPRCPSPPLPDPGPTVYEQALLSTPSAQALVARLDAATDSGFADRGRHVRQVALAVLVARGEA